MQIHADPDMRIDPDQDPQPLPVQVLVLPHIYGTNVKTIYIFNGSQRLVEVSDMEMLKHLHDRLVLSIGKKCF
jgi:hypothetical protein